MQANKITVDKVQKWRENMNNFIYNIPTKIYFGKGSIENLSGISALGKTVLMHYGGGSIKRNGIYDRAVEILKATGMEILELPGVEPNPRIDLIREGQTLCKEKKVDVVLAIGGGSVIDSAKVIARGQNMKEILGIWSWIAAKFKMRFR